eukprot:366200-Chlamydomonas_euryale.AAC.7
MDSTSVDALQRENAALQVRTAPPLQTEGSSEVCAWLLTGGSSSASRNRRIRTFVILKLRSLIAYCMQILTRFRVMVSCLHACHDACTYACALTHVHACMSVHAACVHAKNMLVAACA